jgi:hypothetical protein
LALRFWAPCSCTQTFDLRHSRAWKLKPAACVILCHPISIGDTPGFAARRLGMMRLRCFTGQSSAAVLRGSVRSRNLFGKILSQVRGRYGVTLAGHAVMCQNTQAFSSEKPPIKSASMPEQK